MLGVEERSESEGNAGLERGEAPVSSILYSVAKVFFVDIGLMRLS